MSDSVFLGIEGGGTRTTAVFATGDLGIIKRAEYGPGNYRLISAEGLNRLFAEIQTTGYTPAAVGIGLAGVRDEADARTVRESAERVWRGVPIVVTNDLEIALAAAESDPAATARVLVLSGTGSCCYGIGRHGRKEKVGGWGHLLGDWASGYDLAMQALRHTIYEYDRHGKWGILGKSILRSLLLNTPEELIQWVQSVDKAGVARLSIAVFEAAAQKDAIARKIVEDAARQLATDAAICAGRLASGRSLVQFVLAGGLPRNEPLFARRITTFLKRAWSDARVEVLKAEGALGAAKLAKGLLDRGKLANAAQTERADEYVPGFDPLRSPTEQRNPRSAKLGELRLSEMANLMLESEGEVVPALRKVQRQIEQAIRLASKTVQSGGRIFYVGAGTSGRLGVLDASECPPTFRAPSDLFQGIIAGGQNAVWQAVEGAEDNWRAGGESVRGRGVEKQDLVIGIAASGRTAFVWGALEAARLIGSGRVLICFNPALEIDRKHRPNVVIAANLGPEILTGSTRLKCGTATKLILNMISTISMVRAGKVVSNLMVDLNPSNVKLRDRAVRIVRELTGCTGSEARTALERNRWVVKKAWLSLKKDSRKRA